MSAQTPEEAALATLICDALQLEDVEPEALDPEARLFGLEDEGLGLDSIDALEIAVAIAEEYGVEIRLDDDDLGEDELREIFRCLRSLSAHIAVARAEG